jgi:hypothetical protein
MWLLTLRSLLLQIRALEVVQKLILLLGHEFSLPSLSGKIGVSAYWISFVFISKIHCHLAISQYAVIPADLDILLLLTHNFFIMAILEGFGVIKNNVF